ncbi:crotonase/enoyl-CoA hydratase family protein [Palleronia caenipelagi]|uniref:Crotonase/enoyl-CoA hydratase family protein n=1 Tax=Palleronia caenipelagi TaxID=2489174 RepID=A0A547Q8F6_9RHOB|nr:crotonase/enoyl-CoA hydratase family protein [Palleronia caenipelagi]TRD22657.1 crotonase/enoyl-CoA hydratase family protein [Palleronia caenipelagi]
MSYETLTVIRDARGVVRVTLNRPDKRNAMSGQMIAELTQMALGIGAEAETRAVVLDGAGDVFCAGGDLEWMRDQIEADRPGRIAAARELAHMLRALNEMPSPLIARLHGGAYGGGIGMACVADVVLADPATRFGLTETRLGLIPATIGPYVLARMGEGAARRVFMSARIFDAEEALELGIVSRIVPADRMAEAVEAEVTPYLSVAPGAVAAAKSLTRALSPRIDSEVIEDTIRRLADIWEGDEARAGIEAFLNRTPPPWA